MGFNWEIKVKGFGPFAAQAGGTMNLNTSRVAIYAGNGQGKSSISRLFRAAEVGAPELCSSIVTRGRQNGDFSFAVKEPGHADRVLRVDMAKGQTANVSNATDYLFHVFNSDYVRDNLAQVNFSPTDDIQGFIIGSENIDVSEKRRRLEELGLQGRAKRDAIQNVVDAARQTLLGIGVKGQTTEFKALTVDAVIGMSLSACDYDAKLAEYEMLSDLNDVQPIDRVGFSYDVSDIGVIGGLLKTPFTRDGFSEEFKTRLRSKQDFIGEGVKLSDGKACPFCGQEYDDDAIALINQYEDYLKGEEAKTVALVRAKSQNRDTLCGSYTRFLASYLNIKNRYDSLKLAFPELANTSFTGLPTADEFSAAIGRVKDLLATKAVDISIELDCAAFEALCGMLDKVSADVANANELVNKMNDAVYETSTRLRNLRKGLCVEMAKKVRMDCDADINERAGILEQYRQLSAEIRNDEAQSKRSKRDAVADLFANLLHEMFGDKYSFDRNAFAIQLNSVNLGLEADDILSDGEKSVLAFCYYVATTLELLEVDEDARRLFFLIDDPISSLDYHYVYSVAHIIKALDGIFGLEKRSVRYLILTHNSAFFNMLARNNITSKHYVLSNGSIDECANHGITPYAEHLKDIYAVMQGNKPKHTTGNSIRQIIETLWRFDNPHAPDLGNYLATNECSGLAKCEYIYVLCQDQSHGASIFDREQPPDEESIRRACWAVLSHIHSRYPGQLLAIGVELPELAVQPD